MRITHASERYGAGVGPDFYGVWKLRGLELIETHPLTDEGWSAAYLRHVELERTGPGSQVMRIHRFNNPIWPIFHLLISACLIFPLLVAAVYAIMDAGGIDTRYLITGEILWVMLGTTVAGWFLFMYLWPKKERWVAGWGLMLLGFVIAVATLWVENPF